MDGAAFSRPDDRVEALRLPPQSVEAEQAVLGGLLLPTGPEVQARVWAEVADLLTEESFYLRDHALIFRAVRHLEAKRLPFDAVTVGDFLERQGMAEHVAGGAYLVELASTTPSAANIRAYAQIVADRAKLRRLIEVGTEIVNAGFQPDGREAVEIIGAAQSRVGSLLDAEPCDLEPMPPVMTRVFDKLQARYERGGVEGAIDGLPLGFPELDRMLNGLKPGNLVILAARPKQGKTTLAQNIAECVALEQGKSVAIFSFEMQPDELGDRMLSSIGNIDGDRVRRGELHDGDWTHLVEAVRKLRDAEIYISRPRAARVEHVVAQVRRQHARRPLSLVIIDYLQLMVVSGDNRAQSYGDVTRALKLMAGELRLPVILLSQLNRNLEMRPDKRPIPPDLRDSGSIEQDADAVLFIYRDEVYDPKSRWKGSAEIIVAMQRNGPSGMVRVRYKPNLFRFEPLTDEWEPLPEEEKTSGQRGAGRAFRSGGYVRDQ